MFMQKFNQKIGPSFKRGPFNLPEVRGLKPDLSNQEEARYYSENGVKMKGIFFTSRVGTTSDVVIDLSGTAKMMLGFKVTLGNGSQAPPFVDPRVRFSININQEQVVQDAFACMHDNTNNYRGEYTPLPRMLSGKDNIRLSWTDVQSQDIGIEFWYI